MNNIRFIGIIAFLSTIGILIGCETEHHDYIYKVKSTASTPIQLTYKITGEDSLRHARLENGETLRICRRNGVSGDDVWNIETSSTIYTIESMIAANPDSSLLSENLSIRSYWPSSPIEEGDSGIYILEITDQSFILSKQTGFRYEINSEIQDSIIISSQTNGARLRKDTLVADKKNVTIGSADIYTYNDKANKKESERRIKKLSGLYSLSISLRRDGETTNRSINLAKEDTLFSLSENECVLNIKESLFIHK